MIYVILIQAAIIMLLWRNYREKDAYIDDLTGYINRIVNLDNIQIPKSTNSQFEKINQSLQVISTKLRSDEEIILDGNTIISSVLSSVSNGLVAIDAEENIIFINSFALDIFDLQLNMGDKIFYAMKDNERVNFIKGLLYNYKEPQKYKIGENFYNFTMTEIENEKTKDKIGKLITITDLTSIIQTENMRRDFVSNVSHELKTPLTSINGFVETLTANPDVDPQVRQRFLNIIGKEANRLKELIDDILLLSFVEQNKKRDKKKLNLNEFFIALLDKMSSLSDLKHINIELNLIEEDPWVFAHEDYLTSIFVNIIDNSIKYSNENTRIDIGLSKTKDHFTVTVKDQGRGIGQEDLPRVFERFYRTDKARSQTEKGTGLGLAIVKHMVKDLDGSITLDSKLGEGTIVSIDFPQIEKV